VDYDTKPAVEGFCFCGRETGGFAVSSPRYHRLVNRDDHSDVTGPPGSDSCFLIRLGSFRYECKVKGETVPFFLSIGAPIILGRCPSLSAHESESMLRTYLVRREKQERERERDKRTARGRSIQCTNNSGPVISTPELLLRQNSVTAHARQT
jgi:hypothetical protein